MPTRNFCVLSIAFGLVYMCSAAPAVEEPVFSRHCRNKVYKGNIVVKECVERFKTRQRPPLYGLQTHKEVNDFLALDAMSRPKWRRPEVYEPNERRVIKTVPSSTTKVPKNDRTYPEEAENPFIYLFSKSGGTPPPYLPNRGDFIPTTVNPPVLIPVVTKPTSTPDLSWFYPISTTTLPTTSTTPKATTVPTTTPTSNDEENYDDDDYKEEEVSTPKATTTTTTSKYDENYDDDYDYKELEVPTTIATTSTTKKLVVEEDDYEEVANKNLTTPTPTSSVEILEDPAYDDGDEDEEEEETNEKTTIKPTTPSEEEGDYYDQDEK